MIAGGALVLLLGSFVFTRINENSGSGALTPQTSFTHSHGIGVDAADASKLYIATHEGLLVLIGEKDLYRVGNMRDDLMGFTAHPTESGMFFSSGHPARGGNIGFQKTSDGGNTWEKISTGLGGPVDFHSMTVSQVNPDIVYGFFGGLQRSVDGGKNWTHASGVVKPITLSSDPIRENVVYAATENGVVVSEDMGDSWKSLSSQLEGGAVSTFLLFSDGVALTYSEKLGGLGRSTDGGFTWKKSSENFDGSAVLYFAHGKAAPTTYAITGKHGIYKSSNQGEMWQKVR